MGMNVGAGAFVVIIQIPPIIWVIGTGSPENQENHSLAVAMECSVELRSHCLFSRMTARSNCKTPGTEIWLTKEMGGKIL